MHRRTASTVLLGVLATLALSACSSGTPDAESPGATGGQGPGVAHVHGLGVDPADGVLYAATHFGLFAIPRTGPATRVAARFQDTMGFTVTGPHTFLGSGHPDQQKDPKLPPRLGLIRSTDAAQSWTTVSLGGKVDFHALHAAHGNVYGWDSGTGTLMVSTDQGRTWDTRGTLSLADFVVSPDNPQVLLATTATGLVRSTDGGRTFAPTAGPRLVVLAWDRSAALVGLDEAGTLHASADGGTTWTTRGALEGPPEALTAAGDALYAAVSDKGVFGSLDGGATWALRYDDAPA